MDSRVDRDQEVDIKELLYGILKEWRLLLSTGCICAAALGGYKAAGSLALQMSPGYGAEKEAEYEEALLAYEDEKSGLERKIKDGLRSLEAQQEYLEESMLMRISPYAEGVASAKLFVRTQHPQSGPPEGASRQGTELEAYPEGTEPLDETAGAVEGAPKDRSVRGDGLRGESSFAESIWPGEEDPAGEGAGQPDGTDGGLVGPGAAEDLDRGQVDALVQAYAASFKEDEVLARAADGEGLDLRYVKELIGVETDGDSPVLTVTVVHQDEGAARALLDRLLAAIEEKESWLEQKIGEHQLVSISETSDLVSDQMLWERQEGAKDRRSQLQEDLKVEREKLAGLTGPEPFGLSKRAVALLGIRYGLLGGVLGVVLAGLIACLRWLLCDRAWSAAEVEKRFGILELGTFGKERKGAFRRVDRFLERLFGIEQALEDEQVYQLIEMRIRTFYPEASRIYVAGLGPDTCKGKLAVRLRKAFPDREVHIGGSVHRDPEALEGAAGCDGVILVAEKDKSTYQEIRREASAVESCRGRLLGCVLV